MPVVGLPTLPVPQTVTPRSAAALMSKELFLAPVVIRSFRSGRASITLRGNGVRSRMPTTTAKPCNALIASSWLAKGLSKTLISTSLATRRPVGKFQRDALIVVENGCSNHAS